MSDDDRARWNQRYEAGAYGERTHPCALLEHWISRWHPVTAASASGVQGSSGRALDVACGAGRNALYLAEQGYWVDALDISTSALALGAKRAEERRLLVNWQEQDLDTFYVDKRVPETLEFGSGYALIIVVRYADLDLVARLSELLKPGGRLLVEAHLGGPLFTQNKEQIGGPGSERFRLAPGALASAGSGLNALHSREALIEDPDGRLMALAQFVGERPE